MDFVYIFLKLNTVKQAIYNIQNIIKAALQKNVFMKKIQRSCLQQHIVFTLSQHIYYFLIKDLTLFTQRSIKLRFLLRVSLSDVTESDTASMSS